MKGRSEGTLATEGEDTLPPQKAVPTAQLGAPRVHTTGAAGHDEARAAAHAMSSGDSSAPTGRGGAADAEADPPPVLKTRMAHTVSTATAAALGAHLPRVVNGADPDDDILQ
mmetsp:Transcript_44168/g.136350  ORF Transcript_44168/g.136350 Transcript_44168/m.136350 type:complete len:112 (+) Transcript_44168:335-670(+)